MAALNVLAVVSEIFPLIKTGGLADVAGALPGALAADGVTVRSLVPGYPPVLNALEGDCWNWDKAGVQIRIKRQRISLKKPSLRG